MVADSKKILDSGLVGSKIWADSAENCCFCRIQLGLAFVVSEMPSTDFPLCWESTGDHWWYASPIDWAAANGHYDLVRELLRIDGNHLIQLASLRRIRRLESVWDDDEHFEDVAKHRSQVAQKLLLECESKRGKDSLIQGGYGGWLLYTAASAGDLSFIEELLKRDPLLVFGEGEYGVTDILYAAARSKSSEVFRLLIGYALFPRFSEGKRKEANEDTKEIPEAYKREMMNRAVHAAARGGNLMMLKELLGDCCDALAFRDVQGSTILHAAAGRGQVEVVKDLIASFDIIDCSDNQGNTALHVAAYRGQSPTVEALVLASPSTMYSRNNNGETFLHMAVTGFQTSIFRRVDHQIVLMKQLVSGNVFNIEEIINAKNNDGRTALHLAIIGNVHTDLVELLMSVVSIDVNVCDNNGMTPLDLLKQRPHSASSELLTTQLISAGGVFTCENYSARRIMASHLRLRSFGISPGTSFKIPDSELFSHMGIGERGTVIQSDGIASASLSTDPEEMRKFDFVMENHSPKNSTKQSSVNDTALRLKRLLGWPKMKKKKPEVPKKTIDEISLSSSEEIPISLRQRYSQRSSLANNKRTSSVRNNVQSPIAKKKFAFGLVQGVMHAMPHSNAKHRSCSSSFSKSPLSSHSSLDKQKDILVENNMAEASGCAQTVDAVPSVPARGNKKLMKRICFGASGSQKQHESYDRSFPSISS